MPENPPNISARIVADSINPAGVRLTSWILRYPRFIHSELMTHRCFSRNAASSRAIPFKKMVSAIYDDGAGPERWAEEKPGMQGGDVITGKRAELLELDWSNAGAEAIRIAENMHKLGLHKSVCNRLLEPFAHMTVLATATNHENFFALRAHPAAQPEFQVLAYRMLAEYLKHEPVKLEWGNWHLPSFGNQPLEWRDMINAGQTDGLKIATARCARLSYLTQDGERSPEKDIALHDRLLADGHLSPFEHCAQAVKEVYYHRSNFDEHNCPWIEQVPFAELKQRGLSHWSQYRKTIEGENKRANLAQVMATKPDWITL